LPETGDVHQNGSIGHHCQRQRSQHSAHNRPLPTAQRHPAEDRCGDRPHQPAFPNRLETAIAETQAQIAAVEEKIAASEHDPEKRKPRAARKARALPESLPRVECVVEPESVTCPLAAATWSGSGKPD